MIISSKEIQAVHSSTDHVYANIPISSIRHVDVTKSLKLISVTSDNRLMIAFRLHFQRCDFQSALKLLDKYAISYRVKDDADLTAGRAEAQVDPGYDGDSEHLRPEHSFKDSLEKSGSPSSPPASPAPIADVVTTKTKEPRHPSSSKSSSSNKRQAKSQHNVDQKKEFKIPAPVSAPVATTINRAKKTKAEVKP
jgi:hypothetical protein